ncbi:MAG: hypothetical protein HKN68_00645 [Saprospiraceae bacterium]|nr:hypothetical protein [Saprospiraceae bacterium]
MCTVTYIPLEGGFCLSSNRDESPVRADNPLVIEKLGNRQVIFPRDTKGGSWLFASDRKEVVCVLNGAHLKHRHQPPYRESRGIIARKYFNYDHPRDFIKSIELKGIEPFTMILAGTEWLYMLRWNEREKHIEILKPEKSYIWSSSTLYTPEMTELRAKWFQQYRKNHRPLSMDDIKFIHRNGSVGDPKQDYVMNRQNIVCTVSISHVHVLEDAVQFEFENLMNKENISQSIQAGITSTR